ncbi:hypothetical protein DL239_15920 [Sedimentitalea sp. CY04]|uniref:DUF4136 domain-containing protein n=1 Tax=Parasedimentitalea denitrificans TaxID=2211118 RepID=A0ABX0W9Z1_9RHOB|nr:YnbE family lipoprotein [Sedimentitalea sp. CY04]NIZ62459.1 hypothetical protein [Sedimentitalea sp. CY04]
MIRILAFLASISMLAACTPATPDEPLEDLGAFSLGHNIVIASKMQEVPGSRDATQEEWTEVLTSEVDARFARYEGDQLYHFGISIEGFFLAPPGVPLVLSPKSVLAIRVTVWDDAAGVKLNPEAKTFTVFETTTADSFLVGSGHTRSKEEQLRGLARNAVGQIEEWILEEHQTNGWFDATSETPEVDPAAPS